MTTIQTPMSHRLQLWATEIQRIAEHIEMGQHTRRTINELHRLATLIRTTAGVLDAGRDPFK